MDENKDKFFRYIPKPQYYHHRLNDAATALGVDR